MSKTYVTLGARFLTVIPDTEYTAGLLSMYLDIDPTIKYIVNEDNTAFDIFLDDSMESRAFAYEVLLILSGHNMEVSL